MLTYKLFTQPNCHKCPAVKAWLYDNYEEMLKDYKDKNRRQNEDNSTARNKGLNQTII